MEVEKEIIMAHIIYLFHCPVHGDETNVLCFRAFNEANKKLWVKFEMVWDQDYWKENELENYLQQSRQSVTSPGSYSISGSGD